MQTYKNPWDMFGLTHDEFHEQTQRQRIEQWQAFDKHVEERGFSGLLGASNAHNAETKTMNRNLPNARIKNQGGENESV